MIVVCCCFSTIWSVVCGLSLLTYIADKLTFNYNSTSLPFCENKQINEKRQNDKIRHFCQWSKRAIDNQKKKITSKVYQQLSQKRLKNWLSLFWFLVNGNPAATPPSGNGLRGLWRSLVTLRATLSKSWFLGKAPTQYKTTSPSMPLGKTAWLLRWMDSWTEQKPLKLILTLITMLSGVVFVLLCACRACASDTKGKFGGF